PAILRHNADDLAAMNADDPMRDRLALTEDRIMAITADMRAVASLPSPLGKTLLSIQRPNGLSIKKVSVPFGVIGVIYEARPNVTFDVFSLCIKAGSSVVLKGGHAASSTNTFVVDLLRRRLQQLGWDDNVVNLLPDSHEATADMLHATGMIDLVIPRGSRRLIDFVRDNARVPVIETGAGVCHTYIHESADPIKARDIVYNAKTRRVSVCNALDTIVIDERALYMLPEIVAPMGDKDVTIYADPRAYAVLDGKYPLLQKATDDCYGREWLDYKLSVKTVKGLSDAIDYVTEMTSGHSETIIAESASAIEQYLTGIDAACVYANASTAFTDGGQFGFGAEIGISTQKLHARGPMALPELTTYKYIVTGDGQTRTS
ncbi:MAG: glutamate-5-semialdehyde dehydrogenase, partial [Muribaculum sp.]|nr:glutamate-5-semialdehyde dehydrogenase [Muribaculum sp.]